MKKIIALLIFLTPSIIFGATFTTKASGDWNTTTIWKITGGTDSDGIPDADDVVIIKHNVTSTTDIYATSILVDAYNISFSVTGDSYVTNDITTKSKNTINISGSLTAGSVSLGGYDSAITVGGNLNISGAFTASTKTVIDLKDNISMGSLVLSGNSISFSTQAGKETTIANEANLPGSDIQMVINSNFSANSLLLTGSTIVFDIDPASTTTILGTIKMTNGSTDLDIFGTLYADSVYLAGGSNNLNVKNGGELYISGGIFSEGSAAINIESGGISTVEGDVVVAGGSFFTLEGTMTVKEDFFIEDSRDIAVNGTLQVADTLSLGWGSISGSGSIYAGFIVCGSGNCSGQMDSGLPIELAYFGAVGESKYIQIEWQTKSETNNDYFTLERSDNGFDFYEIATIAGSGNTSKSTNYSFTDKRLTQTTAYYRLRQTDYDGAFSFSKTIAAQTKEHSSEKMKIYPMPYTSGELYIQSDLFTSTTVAITIIDIKNNIIFTEQAVDENGTITIGSETASQIQKGVYFISATSNNINAFAKCIIK